MRTKLTDKLSVKLIVSISLVLACILAIFTYITISKIDESLTRSKLQSAYNISDLIKKSTRYSMLLNRREDVHQIIRTVGTEAGIKNIRIYNKQGMIIFSTDTSEIFHKVDMSAEACIVCHNSTIPLTSLQKQNKTRIFKDRDGKRVLGLINPIQNEPSCSSTECHAHSPNVKILGVLDVVMSLDDLDSIKAENTRNTTINAIVITVAISLVCGFFITILVNKPIKKLTKGIEEVGKGNLNYKIEIDSKDELGDMAKQFNRMSERLEAAYNDIKNWSETLNDKVNEKTKELKYIYSQVNQIEKLASLGKLSATVAHELNNPMEGILTYSKLISKKLKKNSANGETDKLIGYLGLISDEASRCGKIVKDLLLFSHGERDELTKEDLTQISDKSIMLINHHLEMHNITLLKEYEDGIPEIYCNPQKIQQALMALFMNSIEAMSGGGKIVLRISYEDPIITVRVTDEGTGIGEKDLRHIFEPFYSTKEAANGTGLGLAVVYGIVANHNGKVEVENTSDRGTTFKVTLPINPNNS